VTEQPVCTAAILVRQQLISSTGIRPARIVRVQTNRLLNCYFRHTPSSALYIPLSYRLLYRVHTPGRLTATHHSYGSCASLQK